MTAAARLIAALLLTSGIPLRAQVAFDGPVQGPIIPEPATSVARLDLDLDGTPEFILSAHGGLWTTASWDTAWTPLIGWPEGDVILLDADLDGDGARQLIGVRTTPNSELLLAAADPFSDTVPMPPGIVGATRGDLNGDGAEDVVCATTTGIVVAYGGADGPTSIVHASTTPAFAVAVVDIDGDGTAEILALEAAGPSTALVSHGTGGAVVLEAAVSAVRLAVADLDGDGDDDLLSLGASGLALRLVTGSGLSSPILLPGSVVPSNFRDARLTDVDDDGDLDLLVTTGDGVHHLLRTPLGILGAGNTGGVAGPLDVLTINGSTGGPDRIVTVGALAPITLAMAAPPASAGAAPFSLYGFPGLPTWSDATLIPFGIGTSVLPPCTVVPSSPVFNVLDGLFPPPCGSIWPPSPAPWISPVVPAIPTPFPITFQAFIVDGPTTIAITNAVILVVT